jgi:hypothetical protein
MRALIFSVVGCLGLAGTAAAPAHAGPSITNGSFEQVTSNGGTVPGYVNGSGNGTPGSSLNGWTNTDGYSFISNGAANGRLGAGPNGTISLWAATASPDGGNFLAVDGDVSRTTQAKGTLGRGTLSQMITGLSIGDNYAISFYQAAAQQSGFTAATSEQYLVTLGGTSKLSTLMSLPAGGGANDFSGWSLQTLVFNATSTSELLSFYADATAGSPPFVLLDGISIADVPEPSAIALILAGGLGLLATRRRKAAQ